MDKRYCFFLNFGAYETQRVTTFVLSSLGKYIDEKEAMSDLAVHLYKIYKNECKDEEFSEWFHTLPAEQYEKARENHSKLKAEYIPHPKREDFIDWVANLSKCSFSGFDGIGDVGDPGILGWEIRIDLLNLMKNEEGFVFAEIDMNAEDELSYCLPDDFFDS